MDKYKANFKVKNDRDETALIMLGQYFGYFSNPVEILDFLLDHGCDINDYDWRGCSIINYRTNDAFVEELLKRGSEPYDENQVYSLEDLYDTEWDD